MVSPDRLARVIVALVLVLASAAAASDTDLSGVDGHPRARFPLALYAPPTGDASLDAALGKVLHDWNAVAHDALGVDAFRAVAQQREAQIIVSFPVSADGLMGQALLSSTGGVIDVPVRVEVVAPEARGRTSRETVFYQVLAHELGHALGLPHVGEPGSLMCCVPGSVNFNDRLARNAYVEARRHPDVASAREQLAAHYARFWR